MSNSPLSTAPLLSWHALSLALPDDVGPVKIEGDRAKGAILLADLRTPKLGLRWTTAPRRRAFSADSVRTALRAEVGADRAKAAKLHDAPGFRDGLLSCDLDPPGRDVWIGVSLATGRLVQLVWQNKSDRPTRDLADKLLPTLSDSGFDGPQHWSVFDLRCTSPTGWSLWRHRFNAGDLTMEFSKGRSSVIVRQIGPASLALKRQTADEWLDRHARLWKQMYRVNGGTNDQGPMTKGMQGTPACEERPTPSPGTPGEGGGEGIERQAALDPVPASSNPRSAIRNPESPFHHPPSTIHPLLCSLTLPRRRRYCFARWVSPQRELRLHHDVPRDRLYLIDADTAAHADAFRDGLG